MINNLTYDVAVVGGGMAGISAAISSSRNGAKTILVEKHPYSGGALTAGMVLHIAGLIDHRRICDDDDFTLDCKNWIVQGLACEYYNNLKNIGGAKGPLWDHELSKFVFDEMLEKSNVDVLYGTQFYKAKVNGNLIKSIEVINRTTKININANIFIDSSGDGDLGYSAGIDYTMGNIINGAMMPATISYMIADIDQSAESIDDLNLLLTQAWKNGDIPQDMKPSILIPRYSENKARNEIWCSLVRQWGDITDPYDYTQMEIKGRSIGIKIFKYLKTHTRYFRNSYLSSSCHQIWPRESRHLNAEYIITENDIRLCKTHDDVIARGGFYLDLHSTTPSTIGFDLDWHQEKHDTYFDIPYRSLIAIGLDNLLLAGRTIGANHAGHSATRVMGTGIATGQATGTAAAILTKHNTPTTNISINLLQDTLRNQNVLI